MLKLLVPALGHRAQFFPIALIGVCLLVSAGHVHADRFKARGVPIPDAPDMFVQGTTQLQKSDTGAMLSLPLNTGESWQLLNRVLAGLGVKPKQQDEQAQRLLTDWILWVWNADLETGRSKPALRALSRSYERHRFEFVVGPGTADTDSVIHISDRARQREIDITPDSEYSWLEWRDAAVQTDAAWSFLRRLQGNFESALSSRLVPSTATAPRIIEPSRSPTAAQQAAPVIPAPPAPPVAQGLPAPIPVPLQPTVSQGADTAVGQSTPGDATRPVVAEKPTGGAPELEQPAPPPPVEAQAAAQPSTRDTQARTAAPPPPPAAGTNVQATPAPMVVQGGLLVDDGVEATWQALLPAMDALGIELQTSDQAQYMLTTQWIDARYDKKNQQFALESKAEERWAFNLWGEGRERHTFQLILLPVDGGARTMVYGYHTGFQVETDQTPDSSQTLLHWKDHKTDPAVAMAFLRRLRLMVRQ